MIDLSISKEEAVALLLLVDREQSIYTKDPTCTPASVVALRSLMAQLETALEAAE